MTSGGTGLPLWLLPFTEPSLAKLLIKSLKDSLSDALRISFMSKDKDDVKGLLLLAEP